MGQDEIIKDIRQRCRMAMNGIASTSMREHGLVYKLNFGLVIKQIKDLSERYDKSIDLAEALWKEETRELKILSTFLYPAEKLSAEKAYKLATEIANQEIREQLCLNLFQEVAFADQLGIEWSNSDDIEIRTTGYWLLVRLLLAKKFGGILSFDYFQFIWDDITSENIFLRNAASLVLKHIGRQSEDDAKAILEKIAIYRNSSNRLESEAYENISFEFDFFWGK